MINLSKALSKDKDVLDHKFFYICGSVIPYNRQWTVEQAILWGATHVLFVDDDMSFPPQAVKELLKNKQYPIIAANCVKRVFPKEFMSRWFDGSEVVTNKDSSGVVEVMGTGNALCLIDIGVFGVVSKPWFAFPYIPETGGFNTEDIFFQEKARQCGIGTFICHEASKDVKHIGVHTYGM